jgi:hypothetical protein
MAKNRLKEEGALHRGSKDIINHNFSDVALCDTQLDRTSSTTLTNVSGMVTEALVPGGTYKFSIKIPTVCTANNGSKFAFKFGAASMLSAAEYTACAYTATAPAVSHGTTTTDQALLCDNASAVVLYVEINGVVVIDNTAALWAAYNSGTTTLQLQAGQHTSHGDTMSVYKYAQMQFEHITTG